MKTIFKEKFLKQIEKLHDSNLKSSVAETILNVETAQTVSSIANQVTKIIIESELVIIDLGFK